MKRLVLLVAAMVTGYSCGDLVIKVDKKSKSSPSSIDASKSASLTDSKFFLDDMDDLRTAAVNTVVKYLEGEDFRNQLRDGFRKFHASLIEEAMKSMEVSTMSLNTEDVVCEQNKLDLSAHKANKYLGIILQSAVLGKIGEFNAKSLNKNLASEADAITSLVLKEIGLSIDGTTTVENIDGKTVTNANVTLSLVPFETDDAATQAADAKRKIKLSFDREVGDQNVGTFDGRIVAVQSAGESYRMNIHAAREISEGLYTHRTRVAFGKSGEEANFVRQLTFRELEDKKIRIIDRITSKGQTEMSAELIDLNKVEQCLLEKVDLTDEDKKADADGEDQGKGSDDSGKGSDDTATDTDTSTDTETMTDTDTSTDTETEVIDDDNDSAKDPDSNPNQSPVQSGDK